MEGTRRSLSTPRYIRITEHLIFWLVALGLLTLYFGGDKPNYWIPLRNNLYFMPLHMGYFYVVAYLIIPRYLYPKKYISFFLALLACCLLVGVLTRVVGTIYVDPYMFDLQKRLNIPLIWEKMDGTFVERVFKPSYLISSIKSANLIVWIALSIKFFKMWYERRQAALEAELNYLKGQIHPHFLFNTLNNLYSLTIRQSPKSPFVVMGLSDILRYMLYECSTELISLKRDIEIIESYIALERLRYEDRLELNLSVSGEIADREIAPLLMLPLVENAFKHGTSEKVGEAWISIDISLKSNNLKLKVSNSKPDSLPGDIVRHKGNIGLSNVKKRLEILYPDAHELKLFNEKDMFAAILEIQLDKRVSI
jgi:LytS/YehU family sensor histidine kinase